MPPEPLLETGRPRPVPTMMPGAVLPAAVAAPAEPATPAVAQPLTDGEPRTLARNQTIRHLATQHALTRHRGGDVELDELLRTAIAIERYIRTGQLPRPQQAGPSDPEAE